MNRVTAILPAAGLGTRMGADTPKQFLSLDGVPVLLFTLRRLAACPSITDFVIATRGEEVDAVAASIASENLGRSVRVVRGGDLLCRLGGEEFVIAMPNLSLEAAMKVAERTRSAIEEEPFVIDRDGRTIVVTVSIGVAGPGADGDPDSLYRRADRALYRSKSEGRNRVTADAA